MNNDEQLLQVFISQSFDQIGSDRRIVKFMLQISCVVVGFEIEIGRAQKFVFLRFNMSAGICKNNEGITFIIEHLSFVFKNCSGNGQSLFAFES